MRRVGGFDHHLGHHVSSWRGGFHTQSDNENSENLLETQPDININLRLSDLLQNECNMIMDDKVIFPQQHRSISFNHMLDGHSPMPVGMIIYD